MMIYSVAFSDVLSSLCIACVELHLVMLPFLTLISLSLMLANICNLLHLIYPALFPSTLASFNLHIFRSLWIFYLSLYSYT